MQINSTNKIDNQLIFNGILVHATGLLEDLRKDQTSYRYMEILVKADDGSGQSIHLTNTELGLFEVDKDDILSSHADAGPGAGPGAGLDACPDTGPDTGLRAVPLSSTIDIEKEEEKEKRIKETLSTAELSPSLFLSEEERKFNAQMKATYPRVCQMKFPLTCTEMQRLLDRGFSPERIGATLRDMENFPKLTKRYVSANLTLRKWLVRWMQQAHGLMPALRKTGYNPRQHGFTQKQLEIVYEYLGEPE